jgi:uncharacterized repeat protein (TIGR03803 family)
MQWRQAEDKQHMQKPNPTVLKMTCTALMFFVATVISLPAQTFTTLVSFNSTNGAYLRSALVQGTDGRFYGTASAGGASNDGTVFRTSASGTLMVLHNFDYNDGSAAAGTLVQGSDGNFYGTTSEGGTDNNGTIFKIDAHGEFAVLRSFDGRDGQGPNAALMQAANGNFYGTTLGGGEFNEGEVFEITPTGRLTTLYNFCALASCPDGDLPFAALVQGPNEELYGTAFSGGASNAGTIFKINAAGTLTTIYNFCSQPDCADGEYPYNGLILGTDGNFYGTTYGMGAHGAGGTVFKVTLAGVLTTLYSFCAQATCTDGAEPIGGVIQGTDGNLYGTTVAGGTGYGTLFQLTPAGALTTLHTFCSQPACADGYAPEASLMQATNGTFYGTTYTGGSNDAGTIFSLNMGLRPFVETKPASGKVGTTLVILGNNLTSATGISFNGTAAAFTVISSTEITATVPTGATTGTVEVVTPAGTLDSNLKFRVIP